LLLLDRVSPEHRDILDIAQMTFLAPIFSRAFPNHHNHRSDRRQPHATQARSMNCTQAISSSLRRPDERSPQAIQAEPSPLLYQDRIYLLVAEPVSKTHLEQEMLHHNENRPLLYLSTLLAYR